MLRPIRRISNIVSVVDTVNNKVTATIVVGNDPIGVAVTPGGSKVYVANASDNTVSVIDTTSNKVTATVNVDTPAGVAVTPDGSKVYVVNGFPNNSVSVIDTATNKVIGSPILVGSGPVAFGVFIQPAIPFSSLFAELVVTGGHHPGFALDARFGLGRSSTGINPPSQPVTLQAGPYTAMIPTGSFRRLRAGRKVAVYAFAGMISNVSLALDILSLGHNYYQLGAAGTPVNLTAVPNPIPVSFSIGNNVGSTTVKATRIP